jgi:hypothetical protein
MPVLLLAPVALALAVLSAHFYRAGALLPLVVTVALIMLLPLRRRWVARLMQAGLVLGALEWLRTLAALVEVRQATGQPFARLAAVLGAVTIATLLCTLLFRVSAVQTHFRLRRPDDHGPTPLGTPG